MKNFLLCSILLINACLLNAQAVYPVQKTTEPQESMRIMPGAEKVEKKAYEPAGWVYSSNYMKFLLPGSYTLTRSLGVLFPDSCLFHVNNQMGEMNIFSCWMHAIGCSFDPYSEAFDRMFANGILPTPAGDGSVETYPYRIDTILARGVYYWGEKDGYNAASPDTMRFFISYHHTYQWTGKNTEWKALFWTSDKHHDTVLFSPMVIADKQMAAQSKGSALKPAAASCITVDYVLKEKDSTYYWDSIDHTTGDTTRWLRYTNIEVPIENGFEVPAGAVVSVIAKFIPGYDYQLGDTIMYGDLNDKNNYLKGYPRYSHNCFRMMYYYEGTIKKAFCDPWGFNFNFYEDKTQRYQTASALYNTIYWPTATRIPYFGFYIATDEETAVTVIDSNIASGVAERESIIGKVFPNPANEQITVSLKNSEPATITLFNALGQEVRKVHATTQETVIPVRDLNAGVYLIRVEQKGMQHQGKFVIQ